MFQKNSSFTLLSAAVVYSLHHKGHKNSYNAYTKNVLLVLFIANKLT